MPWDQISLRRGWIVVHSLASTTDALAAARRALARRQADLHADAALASRPRLEAPPSLPRHRLNPVLTFDTLVPGRANRRCPASFPKRLGFAARECPL